MSAGTPYFTAIWTYDTSATSFGNHTNEARRRGGTSFELFDNAADYLILGDEDRFDLSYFDIDTAGSLGDLTWQYWSMDSGTNEWKTFVPSLADLEGNDEEEEFDFSEDGAELFLDLPNWGSAVYTASGTEPDAVARYYIRVTPASVATSPTVKMVRKRSYNAYCSPSEVYEFLNLRWTTGGFSSATTPSLASVENIIHRRQAYIDRMTRKSWRPNIAYEYHSFNLAGVSLKKKPVIDVLKVEIWNGTSWEVRTPGRNEEVFFVPSTNKINFSRLFLLPARFTGLNRGYYGAGIGEFSNAVRVKYLFGRNRLTDEAEGDTIKDAAIKLSVIDLLTHHDFTKILTTGGNSMDIQTKIMTWQEETTSTLQSLRSWETF
jgi:hypothetical protein